MFSFQRFKEINDLFASGQNEKARHALMEIQSRGIALRDEIARLKIRLQTLEDALYLSKNLYLENGLYWLRIAGIRQGPFCPRCYESDGGLIRLEKHGGRLACPYCNTIRPTISTRQKRDFPSRQARIIPFAR